MANVNRSASEKRAKVLSILCYVLGVAVLICVCVLFLPISVPQSMGYGVFTITSESMEPAIPIGSVVYVTTCSPEEIQNGEVVAFYHVETNEITVHRVMENNTLEGQFTTKGDANSENDVNPLPYGRLIGRVVKHLPFLGEVANLLFSTIGKVCMLGYLAVGFLFILLGKKLSRLSEPLG